MRGLSRLALLGAGLAIGASMGCGGAEFVLGTSDDGGTAPSMDATVGSDSGGGSDAGGASDAARGPDAEGKDAGKEPSDAGEPADVTVPPAKDAGGSAGGDAGFSCPSPDTTVIFCSNFDTTSTPPWNWDGDPVYGSAQVANDTTNYLSAPNSFAASNGALGDAASYTLAELQETTLTSFALHIDFNFHAYVKTYDTMGAPDVPFAEIGVGTTSSTSAVTSFNIALVLRGAQIYLVQTYQGTDGGEQIDTIQVGPYTTAKWTAVEMLLDRSQPDSWTITVYTEGVSRLEAPTVLTLPTSAFQVGLGVLGVLPPSGPNEIEFDNVAVRAY